MIRTNLVFAFTTCAALIACGAAPEGSEEQRSAATDEILNGVPANSPRYAAVGALVMDFPEFGYYDVFCSATLVGARSVLTARHCTPNIDLALMYGGIPYMAFGPDAFNPEQLVPITGYVNAPPSPTHPGLLLDGGRDVAVAYLASKPVGIRAAALGKFKPQMLGQTFQMVGYGVSDFMGTVGQRFAGTGTARALGGQWYSLLFDGDKQAYLDWYFTDAVTSPTPEEAESWWTLFNLEPGYELLAAGLPGESVACYGDSGGPLLQGSAGADLTVYGVSFAVESQFSTICGLGNAYAILNEEMHGFVRSTIR